MKRVNYILSINEEGQYEAIEEPLPPSLLEKLKSEFILKDDEEEEKGDEQRHEEEPAEVPFHQPMTKKNKNGFHSLERHFSHFRVDPLLRWGLLHQSRSRDRGDYN